MDDRVNRIAALANISSYDSETTRKYVAGAPHIKHSSIRKLYGKLLVQVFDNSKKFTSTPTVLDLGAGEGSVTLPFLELGANVVAIDISASQLDALRKTCRHLSSQLDTHCDDVFLFLKNSHCKFDIIVFNSFLHHIPDYLGIIDVAMSKLNHHGQIFSFQDSLRKDTINQFTKYFTDLSYFSWRVFQDDVIGGLSRRIRRSRGIFLDDSCHDNAEYHEIRNGVDHAIIQNFLESNGFICNIIKYYSTQNVFFQPIGEFLKMKNTFSLIAQKKF